MLCLGCRRAGVGGEAEHLEELDRGDGLPRDGAGVTRCGGRELEGLGSHRLGGKVGDW